MSDTGRQIKELFEKCLDVPPEKQAKVIAASDYSAEVKEKVGSLLKQQHKELDLSAVMLDAVKDKLAFVDLKPGDLFNEYELIKPIGRGGQGEVWLAKRADGQFEQKVAIKILKPIHQPKEEQRFLAERSLLAQLSHPNIAPLISGGKYSDDRLYMVLEWVDGSDIITYVKDQDLNLEQRLRLFIQICEAVKFAHQSGIIHRDIKPSNVLVNPSGVVKLLDFGVAKSKDLDLTETQHEQMLTMAYASPEQIKGEKVSTVTDVYALGLLLYELLTLQRALSIENNSPVDVIQQITRQLPPVPSQQVPANPANKLSTKIDKELDNLVMMALRKEPERRYQTVENFSQDIKNYLDHKPLQASGDSRLYKLKKMMLRNPVGTAMGFLVLLALVAFQFVLVNFNQQLSQQRDQALQAQQQAETQALIANQTKDFLITLLKSASPLGSGGKDIVLSDVLALGERQIINGLDEQAFLKTALLETLASIQHNLGDYKKAYNYYLKTLELATNNGYYEQALLAEAQLALNAAWMDQFDLSLEHLAAGDKLLAQVEAVPSKIWYAIIKSTCLTEIDHRQEGLEWANKALQMTQQASIDDPQLLGRIHNELGVSYGGDNNFLALEHHQKALKYGIQVYGKMHPKTYTRILNNAMAYQRLERYDEANKMLQEAEIIGESLYPKNHPHLGSLAAERAVYLHDRGAFQEALPKYQNALEIAAINEGKESSEYAVRLNNLAYLYEDLGRYQEAEQAYRDSIQIRLQIWGEDSYSVASARSNLARLLAKQNKLIESQHLSDLLMPVYEAAGRSNFYNQVTLWAIQLQQAMPDKCGLLVADMQPFLTQLNQESAKSWRRLGAQLWLGRLFYNCGESKLAENLLKSVLLLADNIYLPDSQGHQLVTEQARTMLLNLDLKEPLTAANP